MRHVIIGAGPAGVVGAETLRAADREGSINLIGDEYAAPYSRMAIPYYLSDHIEEQGMLLRKEAGHFEGLRIAYRQGQVSRVDPGKRTVHIEGGASLPYDRLLIATGSVPVAPPIPGLDKPGVHHCWTVQDAREIHRLAVPGAEVVLIGAGFIGSIILNALYERKARLSVVETENRMVPRMMNEVAGTLLKDWCLAKGVKVLTSAKVEAVEAGRDGRLQVRLKGGEALSANVVIVATGVRPRIDFLAGSGIATGQGVLVDEHLRTSLPDVYAAGDVAQGIDFSAGGRAVHPIQPTATEHGRIAALNMAGIPTPYQGSLIMNVLDTVGLVSYSFGRWMGAPGSRHAERLDRDSFRYLRLELLEERVIGGIVVGGFDHIGLLRGLIQGRFPLGKWEGKLLENPALLAEAYMAQTLGVRLPA